MHPLRGIIDVLQHSAASVPSKLYKYGHMVDNERMRYAKELFEDSRLYFSSPDSFNDPFDSAIKCVGEGSRTDWKRFYREHSLRYKPELKRAEHLRHEKYFLQNRQEFIRRFESDIMAKRRQFGVFCMTHKNDNILMWAHYAGNHKGFCIEFQTDDSFLARAREVRYEKERPQANLLGPWEELTELAAKALLTKAVDWDYEKEWRIIDLDGGPGIQKCPPESISGVIFGSRMSMGDRQQVREWCKNRNPRPTFYEARMKDREFGLNIVPISH